MYESAMIARCTRWLVPTLREDPADAEGARQHLLMHRGTLGGRRRSATRLADGHSR